MIRLLFEDNIHKAGKIFLWLFMNFWATRHLFCPFGLFGVDLSTIIFSPSQQYNYRLSSTQLLLAGYGNQYSNFMWCLVVRCFSQKCTFSNFLIFPFTDRLLCTQEEQVRSFSSDHSSTIEKQKIEKFVQKFSLLNKMIKKLQKINKTWIFFGTIFIDEFFVIWDDG